MGALLKSQKNELFSLIKTVGMDPSDFRWTHLPDLSRSILDGAGIRHLTLAYGDDYEFFFQFQQENSTTIEQCVFSPGDRHAINGYTTTDWSGILYLFNVWLQSLSREINIPDFWNALEEEKQLIHAASISNDASFFTPEEQQHVTKSLNEIKDHIYQTLSPSEPQKIIIDAQIKYLQNAPERLTKKDWGLLLLGQLLAIAVEIARDPVKARELFRFAGDALSWLFHGRPLIP